MKKETIKLINQSEFSAKQYFVVSPYSSSNSIFPKVSTTKDFFEGIYVSSNKTYERLARLAQLTTDKSIKCLIVTGYSGSGKTNFLHYCEAIINSEIEVQEYSQNLKEKILLFGENYSKDGENDDEPDFFDEVHKNRVNEVKKVRREYRESLVTIKSILPYRYYDCSYSEIRHDISKYFNDILKGKTIFFDFDVGKQERRVPMKLKLTRHIENYLKTLSPNIIISLCDFYDRNQDSFTEAFENMIAYHFEEAIHYIRNCVNKQFSEYKHGLLSVLGKLEIDQLLCIEVLLSVAESIDSSSDSTMYYILDNIDMLSGENNDILLQTIEKCWDFTREIQSLMNSLNKKGNPENLIWVEAYERVKYIFSMRETTAMHVGDHLRARIREYSLHFDISTDINKSFIIKKRYDLVKKHVETGEITNRAFLHTLQGMETIVEDKFYKWVFFSLFNDDYRKSINLLCMLSQNDNSPFPEAVPLLKKPTPYMKFGGRGIVLKCVCDSFRDLRYLNYLRVPMKGKIKSESAYNVTLFRIILTVLDNLQTDTLQANDSEFFILNEQAVTLRQLYEKVSVFCKGKEDFVECIEVMFSGRNWNFWNHLITFDNLLEYSRDAIMDALSDSSRNNVYIRCTTAGKRYLSTISAHFEFFSSRYALRNCGLFCMENTRKNRKGYKFERIIEQVFTAVSSCCIELKKINEKILEVCGYTEYEEILDSSHYIFNKQFHEERIIHNHISYIDAYRMYLINGPLSNDVATVNRLLIDFIKQYLSLLQYDNGQFYSMNSEKLYNELNTCIGQIEQKEYIDFETIISRDFFEDHLK